MKDTESFDGQPTKISVEYMYVHERAGQHKEGTCNPPQIIMIDHKSGRVWSYRVPNKGFQKGPHGYQHALCMTWAIVVMLE